MFFDDPRGGGGAIRVVHWRVVTVVHDGSCRIQELYQDLTGFEVFLPTRNDVMSNHASCQQYLAHDSS